MTSILTISRPINRSREYPIFYLDQKLNEKLNEKLKEYDINPKLIFSESSSILTKYLTQKKADLYQFPKNTRINVMKGKFFFDPSTNEYVVNPTNWWVSEKLDGIRAIWTGKQLMTRTGKIINAPDFFIKNFPPNISLDGELYTGRNQFDKVQMTVLDIYPNKYFWEKIKYHVFDIPDSGNLTFEEVQRILNHYLPMSNYLQVISQLRINNFDHLMEIQQNLVKAGAEGTMLRRTGTSYYIGETVNLLKFKSAMDVKKMVHLLDDLGIIVGYKYNYEHLRTDGTPAIKSLMVRWNDKDKFPQDPEFSVSHHLTKIEKFGNYETLFPINQKIKVIYNQLYDSQKPRFPRYGGFVYDA